MLSVMNQKDYRCNIQLYRYTGEKFLVFTYTHKTLAHKAGLPLRELPCQQAMPQEQAGKLKKKGKKETVLFDITRNSQKTTFFFTSYTRAPK
jgi:hypothetical protein